MRRPPSAKRLAAEGTLLAVSRRSAIGTSVGAGIAVALLMMALLFAPPDRAFGTLEWLAAHPIRFGIVLLALAAIRPFLAWPNTLIAVAVGYGYGWAGVPFGVTLLTLTALPAFWLARAGRLRARADFRIADRICNAGERLTDETGSVRAVAATRLFPIPSDAVSVGAGVSGIRTRPFLLGTAIGELPWTVIGVAVGISLDQLATVGVSGVDPAVFVAMAGLGVLLLSGPLYRLVTSDQRSLLA